MVSTLYVPRTSAKVNMIFMRKYVFVIIFEVFRLELLKKSQFIEYECDPCRLVLFGNMHSVHQHMKEPVERNRKEKGNGNI